MWNSAARNRFPIVSAGSNGMSREFRLANWLVTPDLNRITDGERSVSVEPQVMEVLVFLAEHPGEVLSKDRILEAVWRDTYVTDDVLAYSISELRKALGDDARSPRFIETIQRRGYRLIAPVQRQSTSPPACAAAASEGPAGKGSLRRAWLVLAAVSVLLLVAAFWYFRPVGALTESDVVLIADIENKTDDPVFDEMLEVALAINLEQSPFLNLFPRERVREMLRYMERSPDEPVTASIAREICQRRSIKAYITGSIAGLGRNYVISLEAVNAHSGDVIAREQVEVGAKETILPALGQAASRMRQKLGESLPSIQRYDIPLEQATTRSLAAFKAYSTGRKLLMSGKWLEAIGHYTRAVELDPDFASAYDDMSYCYRVARKRDLSAQAAQKAFDLRDRVSEYERRSIEVAYYMFTTEELDKAIAVTETMRSVYPHSSPILDTLAGLYFYVGLYEKALDLFDEAISIGDDPIAEVDRAIVHLSMNNLGKVKECAARIRTTDSLAFRTLLFHIGFIEGDAAAMTEQVEWARGKPGEPFMLVNQSNAAAFLGRMSAAREYNGRAIALAKSREISEAAADFTATMARTEALMGYCGPALESARSSLAEQPDWRGMAFAAMALAICGEVNQAGSIADEIAQRIPTGTIANELILPILHALIDLARGDGQSALQSLKRTEPYEKVSAFWTRYTRGQAHLQLRNGTEAAAEFQRILDVRGQSPLSSLYPLAYLGIARASALVGDRDRSAKAYESLFALWKDADRSLPILQQARKEYDTARTQASREVRTEVWQTAPLREDRQVRSGISD